MSDSIPDSPTAVAIPRVCMIGPFPPPRHGMSTVNELVYGLATDSGLVVAKYNTAPPSLDRRWRVLIRRWPRVMGALLGAIKQSRQGAVLYCSVSGGWGLLYDLACVLAVRLAGRRPPVLHHHSFRYIEDDFWPMRLLVWAAGRRALHVVLGETMATRLRARYPGVVRTLVLSNAGLLDIQLSVPPPSRLGTIGYISNLSAAKGLDDVLATAEQCRERLPGLKFVIAGPFENSTDEAGYRRRMSALSNVDYIGPVYGPAKANFFARVEAVLFPTRYRHEAEPLVILEALSCGRPVIAFDRGCIASLLDENCGAVIPRPADFAAAATEKISAWCTMGDGFVGVGRAALHRFETLRVTAANAKNRLLLELSGG